MTLSRVWFFAAAAFFFQLSTDPTWACTTHEIEGMGTLDLRAPIAASVPGYTATLQELRAAAQYERQTYIIDAHAQRHNLFFFFFHTAQTIWKIYAVIDASEVMYAEENPLFLLAEYNLAFDADGNPDGIGGIGWGLVWASGEEQELYVDLFEFEQHAGDAVIVINGGRLGPCPQYGDLDLDYDGDDDFVIWRPAFGMWAVLKSASDYSDYIWVQWGLPGDYPFVGDYTGDGHPDLVVWRPSNGTWYICPYYLDCHQYGYARQFGLPTDRPLKGDFDHDGIFDLAVWRPSWGTFFYLSSSTNNVGARQWGLPGDIPIAVGSNR